MTGLREGEAQRPVMTPGSGDLTRPDRGEAMDRLVETVLAIPDKDERVAYLFLACGYLAKVAPDVLSFLLDRADAVVTK